MLCKLVSSALVAIALSGASAFALEFPAIRPNHADYNYYMSAINLDKSYVIDQLIAFYSDYSFAGDHSQLGTISGRIVSFRDGPRLNPHNLVLTVNGNLYYVNTELNTMEEKISVRREWKNSPGIYFIVRGTRRGPNPGEMVPVRIMLRVATVTAKALSAVEYTEDVLGPGAR